MDKEVIKDFNQKKRLTPQQARPKIEYFCQYRERCQSEVSQKLYELGLSTDEVMMLLYELVKNNTVNETRYSKWYAHSKLRHNQWGKTKIKIELKRKQISEKCIKEALKDLDDEEYESIANNVANKYTKTLKKGIYYVLQQKLIKYMIGKGFEMELSQELAKKHIQKK